MSWKRSEIKRYGGTENNRKLEESYEQDDIKRIPYLLIFNICAISFIISTISWIAIWIFATFTMFWICCFIGNIMMCIGSVVVFCRFLIKLWVDTWNEG